MITQFILTTLYVYKMSLKITLIINQKFMRLENQGASAVQTQLEIWLMWALYLYGYKDVFAKEFYNLV